MASSWSERWHLGWVSRCLEQLEKSLGKLLPNGNISGELLSGVTVLSSQRYGRVWMRVSLTYSQEAIRPPGIDVQESS